MGDRWQEPVGDEMTERHKGHKRADGGWRDGRGTKERLAGGTGWKFCRCDCRGGAVVESSGMVDEWDGEN